MSLRILHVIDSLDPRLGGPPAVCMRLASAQALLGNEVSIVSRTEDSAVERANQSLSAVPGINAVKIHRTTKRKTIADRVLGASLSRWICDQPCSPDVIHVHSVWEPAVLAAAFACRKSRIPYVITPHGTLDSWGMNRGVFRRLKKRIALQVVFRQVLDNAAFLHMLNEGERQGLRPLRLRAPTVVLPNGVFAEEQGALPPLGTFRASHPELGNDPYLLFLARVDYMKGLDRLVAGFAEARKTCRNIRLVVAGPDFGAERSVRRLCSKLGVDDCVCFVGPLYGADKLAALADARAYGLVSRYEGFSIALLEAMIAGLPVIISKECRFPEVVAHDAGAVVDPRPEAVASAIVDFMSDSAKASAAGARGRALVSSSYTWQSIADRMCDAYRQLKK